MDKTLIKLCVLLNRGGLEQADDQQIVTLWHALDDDTKASYLTSVERIIAMKKEELVELLIPVCGAVREMKARERDKITLDQARNLWAMLTANERQKAREVVQGKKKVDREAEITAQAKVEGKAEAQAQAQAEAKAQADEDAKNKGQGNRGLTETLNEKKGDSKDVSIGNKTKPAV